VAPPDPNDQVAIMSGNSAGIAVSAVSNRFSLGQEILVLVYSGDVMAIPDFTISPPGQLILPATGTTANAGTMNVSRNQAFSGTVTLSTVGDPLDSQNPLTNGTMTGGTGAITYSPNAVTPTLGAGNKVDLLNITTAGATPGIYVLWVKGQAGSPYLTTKYEPMAVKIGTVSKDFTFTADTSSETVASGGNATFDLALTNSPNKNTSFGGTVSLSLDEPHPDEMGSISFSPNTLTPSKLGTHSTLTIHTDDMAPGMYSLTLRATGTNNDSTGRKVTHVIPITLYVGTSASTGNQSYVDIIGFAVMRISAMDANSISAYAISPVIPDMNDPRLRRGQVARLVPWS
jgi:hypothetical protein